MNLQYISDSKGKHTGVFIPISDWEELIEKVQELKKYEIIDGLKSALKEVKLHQEGKIKLQSAKDFLNEL